MQLKLWLSLLLVSLGAYGSYAGWRIYQATASDRGSAVSRDRHIERTRSTGSLDDAALVDTSGKPFSLDAAKGDVVLVVFWATWCVPNAQEVPWLDYLENTYKAQGFRIVSVNVDAIQHGGKVDAALPTVKRFLLDYNVTWPTLMSSTGAQDYASAFKVTQIPSSVLIGRDGKVTHIDLTGRKLEKAIASSLGAKR